MKKTLGKRRIAIQKIGDSAKLQVAFSKRRTGLFKKAASLSILCGTDLAILVSNPSNSRVFSIGNPNPDAVIDAFLAGKPIADSETVEGKSLGIGESSDWWMSPVEELGLPEFEEYIGAIEVLKNNVLNRANELAMEARNFAMAAREEICCSSTEAAACCSESDFLGFDEESHTVIGGIDDVAAMERSDLDSIFVDLFEEYGFDFNF